MLSIAMCTYNGARYLAEQLASIFAQTVSVDELVVVDDGSTDGTMEILAAAAREHPAMRVVQNEHPLGACRNFERAISLCTGDYIACADQDDVWLPDKLACLLASLQAAERELGTAEPILVHSDLRVVDRELSTISESFMASSHLLPVPTERAYQVLAVSNYVTGCAMMFNRALVARALPFGTHAIMHDYYLALVASLAGTILYMDRPTILYRQHGDNTIGALAGGVLAHLQRLVSRKSVMNTQEKIAQLREILATKSLVPERARDMENFLALLDNRHYLRWLTMDLKSHPVHKYRNQNIKRVFFCGEQLYSPAGREIDLIMLVATHKRYAMPAEPIYRPIQVGRSGREDLGYTGDDSGDNISARNPSYCELTAIYWAWKNLRADFIGLCHYRRYFGSTAPFSGAEFSRLLTRGVVIVPRRHYFMRSNVRSQYARLHNLQDWECMGRVIADLYPEYSAAFHRVERRHYIYPYNMFVMDSAHFAAYAEFLFTVLFEVERRIDITSYDSYQRRVFGFLAERLFNVWLEKINPTLREVAVFETEKTREAGLMYRLRRFL